jgi:GMP synthase-like glutamine amidotransferase
MAPVEDLIRRRHAAGRKVVGLCFGHQLIARALGGHVGKQPQGLRLGTAWTHLTHHAPWMDPPKDALRLLAAHEDQVFEAPPGAQVLGGDALCPVGLMTVGPHVLGTQYHPELSLDFMADLLHALAPRLPPAITARASEDLASGQPMHAETFGRWIARFIETP